MIDFYTWTTPNGRKVSILLEELGVPYNAIPVNIGQDEQFKPDFLKIAPNNKIPAIVDHETGVEMMETGAIMLYLAEKHGKFIGTGNDRLKAIEWLMWQMGGLGPMLGQAHHFLKYNAGKSEYAEQRYSAEAERLYGVLDRRLGEVEFLSGDSYSIADIAVWPWVSRFEWQQIDLRARPNVRRWYETIAARPAVQRGYDLPMKVNDLPMP